MNKRRPRIKLRIDSLAAGGDGVGRDDNGRVTFVPQGVPGDSLLVELLQDKKQFARGKIVSVLEASPNRVEAKCKLFTQGLCGGCQWQAVNKETQAHAKKLNVEQGLRKAVEEGMDCAELLQPCQEYGWRRRTRLSYWAGGGKQLLGFYPSKSNKITDVEECPQLSSALQESLKLVRTHLMPAFRHRGEVELLLAEDGKTHVVVHGTVSPAGIKALAAESSIAGVKNGKNQIGATEVLLEHEISGSADGFAQASRAGNIALCATVESALGDLKGKTVLELFAGTGNFTRLLAEATAVVAVEIAPMANQPKGVDWQELEVYAFLEKQVQENKSYDIVLLDPPRMGAKESMKLIAALNPTTIVYVSCDVATLSRDVSALSALGYIAKIAQPVDLMPQTSHVEIVVTLVKGA